MLWNGSGKRVVPGCDEKLLRMYFRTRGIPTGTLKALLKRVCCWKHTLLSYLVPISFKIFIHVLAFLCVKANSKEICQEISFSSFFFRKMLTLVFLLRLNLIIVYPFFFLDSESPCKYLLFPHVPNLAQKPLYLVASVHNQCTWLKLLMKRQFLPQ